MNQRRLSPTDLQSVAFDHSAILPRVSATDATARYFTAFPAIVKHFFDFLQSGSETRRKQRKQPTLIAYC